MSHVQLQVNTSGAWKTVMQFDASDSVAAQRVRDGAALLHAASPRAGFRIATCGSHPEVLAHIGANTYGLWIDAQRSSA